MRLIDYTFFQSGLTVIPIHDADSEVGQSIIATINTWIDYAQETYIRKYLGAKAYDFLLEELEEDPVVPEIELFASKLKQALKYFAYFEYERYRQTLTTEAGEVNMNAENLRRSDNFVKQRKVYNIGVMELNYAQELIDENPEDYEEFAAVKQTLKPINALNI